GRPAPDRWTNTRPERVLTNRPGRLTPASFSTERAHPSSQIFDREAKSRRSEKDQRDRWPRAKTSVALGEGPVVRNAGPGRARKRRRLGKAQPIASVSPVRVSQRRKAPPTPTRTSHRGNPDRA